MTWVEMINKAKNFKQYALNSNTEKELWFFNDVICFRKDGLITDGLGNTISYNVSYSSMYEIMKMLFDEGK